MISTSHIMTGPLGLIGASPNMTRKRSGTISASLNKIGTLGMIGASPNKTRKM